MARGCPCIANAVSELRGPPHTQGQRQQQQQQQQQQQPTTPVAMDWQMPAAAATAQERHAQTARHSSLPEGSRRLELQWRPTV
jgi:hypothetical protein